MFYTETEISDYLVNIAFVFATVGIIETFYKLCLLLRFFTCEDVAFFSVGFSNLHSVIVSMV